MVIENSSIRCFVINTNDSSSINDKRSFIMEKIDADFVISKRRNKLNYSVDSEEFRVIRRKCAHSARDSLGQTPSSGSGKPVNRSRCCCSVTSAPPSGFDPSFPSAPPRDLSSAAIWWIVGLIWQTLGARWLAGWLVDLRICVLSPVCPRSIESRDRVRRWCANTQTPRAICSIGVD